ncbi:MAG: right-handed parallel beta-helix repeat-containing protein [Pirellulaceae bacterium]
MRIVNGYLVMAIGCGLVIAIGGSYAAPQNGTERVMKLPGARPTIHACEYGSLQAAFDAIPEAGGLLQLPAGTFEISEPLVLSRSDVCIQGAGTATHIKNTNVEGLPAIIIEKAGITKAQRKDQLWRVRLTNLRVTGNEKSGHGIEVRWVNEVLLDAVSVSNHGGDGIRLDTCYEDPRVSNCLITYNKRVGLNCLGCHDIVVSANQFEENEDAVHCVNGYNLTMSGNCLDDHLGNGVVIENTYGSVVSANMIEECVGTAIVLSRDCYGTTLSSNVIAHNGAGIDLVDAHGCCVSANTFTIMKTNALRIGPGSGRIAVTGNSFSNSYLGDGEVKRAATDLTAAGVLLDGTSEVTISGNTFSGVQPAAVALSDKPTTRLLFSNNVITETRTFLPGAAVEDSRIEGNLEAEK